jgi:hypothetical protein
MSTSPSPPPSPEAIVIIAVALAVQRLLLLIPQHTPETLNCELIVDPEVMQLINWQFQV